MSLGCRHCRWIDLPTKQDSSARIESCSCLRPCGSLLCRPNVDVPVASPSAKEPTR